MYGTLWRTWTSTNGYEGEVLLYEDEAIQDRSAYEKGELKSATPSGYGYYVYDYEVRLKQHDRYQECVDAGYFS